MGHRLSAEGTIALSRLDSRSRLLVDTRPLGRQPGSMRLDSRTSSPPEHLAVGMIGVPEDTEVELSFRLEAVMDGVLITGTVRAELRGECARCLDPISTAETFEFQELFRYPDDSAPPNGAPVAGEQEPDGVGSDEAEDYYLEGEVIDLEPVVRDAVVLGLPSSPLCRQDCPGLCVECGVRLAEVGPGHGHGDGVDPRWESLRGYRP